jgi:hypothetical protein
VPEGAAVEAALRSMQARIKLLARTERALRRSLCRICHGGWATLTITAKKLMESG